MNRHVVIALLDQVIISGTMFCMNLALITFTTPDAYGRFVLVFSLNLVAFAIQNSLILMPISVLLPGRRIRDQHVTLRALTTFDISVVGFSAIVVGLLVAAFQLSWEYCLGAMLLVVGASGRELHRAVFQTRQLDYRMVLLDCVAMVLAALFLFLLFEKFSPEMVAIYALAIGNIAAVLICGSPVNRSPRRMLDMMFRYQVYWKKSRWALLSSGLTEAQLRLYIYIVEIARGSAVLGVLHAGRVLINPLSLLAYAWGRASRPIMAGQFAANDRKGAIKTLLVGILITFTIGVLYILCLNYFWPDIERLISNGHGAEIGALLWLWSIFGLISLPSICISVYFQASHRFRQLSFVLAVSVITSSLLLMGIFIGLDISYVIWALIIGEIIMSSVLVVLVWRDHSILDN